MILKPAQYCLAVIALCSVSLPFSAQAETVVDAVRATILNHPQVEQAKARIDALGQEEKSEKSAFYPDVSVGASYGRIFGNNSTSRGSLVTRDSAYSYFGEVSIAAQQPIFDGFETRNRVDAAQAGKQSADMTLSDVREQLAFRTVQAYLNVAQARTGFAMLKAQELKGQDYLQRIDVQVKQGSSDEAEYQQARDVLVVLKGFVSDYKAQLANAESQFFELTGRMPSADMQAPFLNGNAVPQSIDQAIADAIAAHPALQSAAFSARSAELDINAEKASLYPDLNGELSYLESDRREEIGGEITDARALLRLNWNFETGGGQKARILQRKHEHKEEMARENEIRRQIERDIRIAYADRDAAQSRLENQIERHALNEKLFDTFEAQFEGARVSLLQLMQADNQLFNTQIEKVIAQYRLLGSQYAILFSMGRLQPTLLQTAGTLE